MIHEEINIKLERVEEEAYLDIADMAYHFWEILNRLVSKYAGGREAARRIINNYFYLCVDDLRWSDDGITLIFSDAAGYCLFSHKIAHHWAEITLAVNGSRFKEMFRSLGWEVKGDFPTVEEIKAGQQYYYFEHNKLFYAIKKDAEGTPYILFDQGEELEYKELPPAKQKRCLTFLEERDCRCPLCRAIVNGKMKKGQITVYNISKYEWHSSSIRKSLKFYRIVEEFDLDHQPDEPFEDLTKFKKLRKLSLIDTNLKRLPQSIASLTNLTSLNISNNPIEELDEFIGNLTNLKELNLSGTKITRLPDSFSKLTSLRKLTINHFINIIPLTFKIKQTRNVSDYEELYGKKCEYNSMKEALKHPSEVITLELDGEEEKSLRGIEKLEKLRQLELSYFRTKSIPEEVFNLKNLESLFLNNSHFKEISERVGELIDLQCFICYSFEPEIGYIKSLPTSFTNLQRLEKIEMIGQSLEEFPLQIIELDKLRYLRISGSSLNSIPAEISKLATLQHLFLPTNKLTELPESIGKLTNLDKLILFDNPIGKLPDSICKLTSLMELDLADTKIEKLPEKLGNLERLKHLTLPKCINSLPPSLSNCPKLTIYTTEDAKAHIENLVKESRLKVKIKTK